ncbi:acyl-CoA dehydrogenase family protein [Paenibacillus guangzhouensis]|uniref:acyl-CoA dehydrogenase family protein n=1 Tax=Paenibacillus guangzhouensis TaxID=1473112 RepID=UPI00126697B4|nr:acyl-CoA dehydrogenase family protein [Paenibacillus guangzhouensis]
MELRLSREQAHWQNRTRQFAESILVSHAARMEQVGAFPRELLMEMRANGLMGIPIPKAWGGEGADFISYILSIHEISKVSAAAGVILSVHTSVGTLPILYYGTDEQKKKYVRKLASGDALGAFALTEPQAGSDAASIRTTAIREGDYYRLKGSKMFITNAGEADTYITFAVTNASQGARGISAFIIERDCPGFIVGRAEKKMGLHGSNTCEITLEDVRIPVTQRLGHEGEGFVIAMGTLDGGRIGIAAQALGIAQAALELVEGARIRKGDSLARRRRWSSSELDLFAELTTQVEAARLLVYRAASMRQAGLPCTKESSMAKMFASDTAMRVTGAVVSMLGRQGCTDEYAAERLFRDAKVTQIYEGTNEIHRIVISGSMLR